MTKDNRTELYNDLHQGQLTKDNEHNKQSATIILNSLFKYYNPASVLDVGCGLGAWLGAAKDLGITDLQGVEGPWAEPNDSIIIHDLDTPLNLNRKFDLVISLEVAEHIDKEYAEQFIASLIRHGDVVLFSAAIPHQGGHGHINEQFLDYWEKLFKNKKYIAVDLFRNEIWNDSAVLWYLKQNTVLFVNEKIADRFPKIASPLSIVHPDVYLSRVSQSLNNKKSINSIKKIFLAVPTYDHKISLGTNFGILNCINKGDQLNVSYNAHNSSLLAGGFNHLWATALNNNFDYFVMLHADIAPQSGWISRLYNIINHINYDIVSAVVPIKDNRKVTSTAIGAMNRLDCYVNKEEAEKLPPVFTKNDVLKLKGIEETEEKLYLLLNTGCWIAKIRDEKGMIPSWADKIDFQINSWITKNKDGRYIPGVFSEDWRMSVVAADNGAKLAGTTAVHLLHLGGATFANHPEAKAQGENTIVL